MTKTRKMWNRAGLDEVVSGVNDGDGERGGHVRKETERSRYWRGVIADWEASGMTQAEFCRSRGLSAASFYYWKSRFKQDQSTKTGTGIVPVSRKLSPRTENHRVSRERQVNSPFIPVDVLGTVPEPMDTDRIMVWLPSGCRLDVPQGFDAESVERVEHTLSEEECHCTECGQTAGWTNRDAVRLNSRSKTGLN